MQAIEDIPFPSAQATRCPYGFYAALRGGAPVHRLDSGEFVVSRHADIAAVTRDPDTFSSHHSVSEDGWMRAATLADHEDPARVWPIVGSDGEDHTAKRRLAFEMFKPVRLQQHEPMIRDHADALIDAFAERGSCEFASEFAEQLPARVILTIFGLPLEHVERAIAWGRYEGFGTRFAEPEREAAAREAIMDLGAFLRDQIMERAESPSDDDLSRHVQRHVELHGELRLPALIAEASNLFIGGIITTTHLLSSMMLLLVRNPEQMRTARSGDRELRAAIEEALRVESPVQMSPRLAVRDTEIDGVAIPAGSILLLLWGSGNRDEEVFACPEQFDLARANVKQHLGFGNGAHFCLGAPLARMEARVAFERLFARLSNIRLPAGAGEPANLPAVIFRGPEALPLEFD